LAQARFHRCRSGGRGDYERASGLARFLAGSSGEREFLHYQEWRTQILIDRYWNDIVCLAAALLERYELTGDEVVELIDPARADRKDKARWQEAMEEALESGAPWHDEEPVGKPDVDIPHDVQF
jgi:hypothetical protein